MLKRFWHRVSEPSILVPSPHLHDRASRAVIFLSVLIKTCLFFGLFLFPLIFSSATVEPIELPKQYLLILLACIGSSAYVVRALLIKRLSFSRNWLHLAVLGFGAAYLLISLCSMDRYLSFVGSGGQQAWAFSTIFACLILYFIIVNEIRSTKEVYDFMFLFLIASFLSCIYGLLQIFGWYLFPAVFTHVKMFTSVGSMFGLAVHLAISLLIASSISFHGCRNNVCLLGKKTWKGQMARLFLFVHMAAALLFLVLVDFWLSWAILVVGALLIVGAGVLRSKKVGHPVKLVLPAILLILGFVLLFFHTPFRVGLSGEVVPSFGASWELAQHVLQADPVLGSGPGTWVYQYSKYRSANVNLSPFWSVRFDRGNSTLVTLLPTIGILGMLLWLTVVVSVAVRGGLHLLKEKNDDVWYAYVMLAAGWLALVFSSFFYHWNITHQFIFWFFTGLLGGLISSESLVLQVKKGWLERGVLIALVVIFVGGSLLSLWAMGRRVAAERLFAKAVQQSQAGKTIENILPFLSAAQNKNPLDDLYPRIMAQVQILDILQGMSGRPTQDQLTAIGREIAEASANGLVAVAKSPMDVENWETLASMYEAISPFTRNANEEAIKYYAEALKREPQNPGFWDALGRLWIWQADQQRALLTVKDQATVAKAKKMMEEALQHAKENLDQSIKAKPDYLPAHYHLAQVYERQGRVHEAIAELVQVLRTRNNDVGIAFELAILLYRSQQFDQAILLLEQIVKAQPENANARWYLALMYEEKGRIPEAKDQFTLLTKQLPENQPVQQRLQALSQPVKEKPLPEPLKEDIKSRTRPGLKTKK